MKTQILTLMLACSLAWSNVFGSGYYEEIIPPRKTESDRKIYDFAKKYLWDKGIKVFDDGNWTNEQIGIVFALSPFKYQRSGEFSETQTHHKFQVTWRYLLPEMVVITYTTFDHYDDGDNTFGWVEDERGNVIAVIDDNDMFGGKK